MTLTIDPKGYRKLLVEAAPKVIETEEEYRKALAFVEKFTFDQAQTPEEVAIYKLFVTLIEAYEAENYPVKAVSPSDVLRHILQVSDVRSADLVGVLGSERVITEILNGDRDISLAQASILADRFKVSPELFLR